MSLSYAVMPQKQLGDPSVLFAMALFGTALFIVYLAVAFGAPDATIVAVLP